MIILKNKKKIFPQNIFDNIFQNIEHNFRELGLGDVKVNKQMKNLTRIFYDILLKLSNAKKKNFLVNKKLIITYFDLSDNNNHLVNDLANYFDKFYNYCFELKEDNMIKGKINF